MLNYAAILHSEFETATVLIKKIPEKNQILDDRSLGLFFLKLAAARKVGGILFSSSCLVCFDHIVSY